MKQVTVNASINYNIFIGSGLLSQAGIISSGITGNCRAAIVTDDTVNGLYADNLENALKSAGYDTDNLKFVIPHGEASKSTSYLVELLEFLAENRLTRKDCIFALGGGVIGDLAGFAAAVYLRGIKFIQVPTTLLAAVDSSVGGKTAVDLRAGKNLAGAFHQPSAVICDTDTLSTLTPEIFSDGAAETIKYGIINDRPLFDMVKNGIDKSDIEQIIARAVENKSRIVAADEFDTGARQLLNLGHTVGHAIEACSGFGVSHGHAVAMGTAIVTRAAVAEGLCPEADLGEILSALTALSLPTSCTFGAHELAAVASADKKRSGDTINLVIPLSVGNCVLKTIPVSELEGFIAKGL